MPYPRLRLVTAGLLVVSAVVSAEGQSFTSEELRKAVESAKQSGTLEQACDPFLTPGCNPPAPKKPAGCSDCYIGTLEQILRENDLTGTELRKLELEDSELILREKVGPSGAGNPVLSYPDIKF